MAGSDTPGAQRFTDPRLGDFWVTREEVKTLRGGRRLVWRNWGGRCTVAGQSRPVLLSLSGDECGPQSGLIAAVCAVLDNLGPIAERAAAQLARRGSTAKLTEFVLSNIVDWDQHDEVLLVEYLPIEQRTIGSDLEFYWPGDDWALHHHIVLRSVRPNG